VADKLFNTEYGNEPLSCINGAEFLAYLIDYQLLKNGSIPCQPTFLVLKK
jgi:hypothetical protein